MDIVAQSLLESDAWLEMPDTRMVWISILMLAEPDGLCHVSPARIAHVARVDPEEMRGYLARLKSLDEIAYTPEGAIQVVEPERFLSADSRRRIQARNRQRRWRQRQNETQA